MKHAGGAAEEPAARVGQASQSDHAQSARVVFAGAGMRKRTSVGVHAPHRPRSMWGDLIAFAVPALQFLEVQAVGRLFASELILLGLLPFLLLFSWRLLAEKRPRAFILLGLLWLAGQILTDLVRSTPFEDYARGWAKVGVTLTNFAALYILLHDNRRRIALCVAGISIGGLVAFYLNPSPYAEGDPWKFGVGAPITFLVILLTSRRPISRWPSLSILLIGGAAILNISMGFRSLGGVCFLTSIYLLIQRLFALRKPRGVPLARREIALLIVLTVSGGLALLRGYEYAAGSGLLGQQAQEKYESDAAGELGIFVGGRSEVLISSRAIMDSPILGHGSWAKDPDYVWQLMQLRRSFGYRWGGSTTERDLIPSHSHILGAWVEAGVLGAVFWLYQLLLAGRVVSNVYMVREALMPLIVFVGFMLIWDVLFSPYGAERRLVIPLYIIVMIFTLNLLEAARQLPVNRRRHR